MKQENNNTPSGIEPSEPGKSNDPDSDEVEREQDDTALVPEEDEEEEAEENKKSNIYTTNNL